MTSRESLVVSVVSGSLAWDDNQEKAVDRVTAIGLAHDQIGALVIRSMANDEASRIELVRLVSCRIRSKCINISASRVAASVLADVIDTACETCGGMGTMQVENGVVKVCHSCNGSKLRDTRRNPRKVGGKRIPDELYSKTYAIYSDGIDRMMHKVKFLLD